jgi:tripartite-type tricarboxylate transporter receptor subunit TctC
MNRDRLIALVAFGLFAALTGGSVAAQGFPSKPVRMIVPYPAGGITDILGRTIGKLVSEDLKQPVIIDNRPGGNGGIGSDATAKSAADGYTILLGASTTHVLNPLLTSAPYDGRKDFTPLAMVAATPLFLVVNNDIPVRSVTELVTWLRANGARASFGSYGTASVSHLAGELLKSMTGVQMTHVPYKGGVPAIADLMGGQIQLVFGDVTSIPQIKAGRIRALAMTGDRRSDVLPDLPTVAEAGVPGYQVFGWFAFFGPARLPDAVAARLSQSLMQAIGRDDIQQQIAGMGLQPRKGSGAEVAGLIDTDLAKWSKVIREAGIKLD